MTYRVVTTSRVDREIGQITQWYFERSGSEKVADKWFFGIQAAISTLIENPDRLPLAPESRAFPFDVFELHYVSGRRKTHRVLFRIGEADSLVQVIGVRHSAQRDLTPDDI